MFVRNLTAVMAFFSAAALCSTQASAQSVEDISGKVFLKAGKSSRAIVRPMRAPFGATVTAGAGSSAVIVYPDGCRQEVRAGTSEIVSRRSPCGVAALPTTNAGLVEAAPIGGAATGAAGAGMLAGAGAYIVPAVVVVGGAVGIGIAASRGDHKSSAYRPVSP